MKHPFCILGVGDLLAAGIAMALERALPLELEEPDDVLRWAALPGPRLAVVLADSAEGWALVDALVGLGQGTARIRVLVLLPRDGCGVDGYQRALLRGVDGMAVEGMTGAKLVDAAAHALEEESVAPSSVLHAVAHRGSASEEPPVTLDPLERQTLVLLSRGRDQQQIAAGRGVRRQVVGDLIKSVGRRAGVETTAELLSLVSWYRLIPPPPSRPAKGRRRP